MTNGPRATLDRKMQERLDSILVLGSMVEQAITGSVRALKDRDLNAAQEIYDNDRTINNKRYEIEEQTLSIVATQQPMARDLRVLSSVLDIAGELERIGDYAKNMVELAQEHPGKLHGGILEEQLVRIEEAVEDNFLQTRKCFEAGDKDMALKLLEKYSWVNQSCDDCLFALIREEDKNIKPRDAVALALYSRQLKRINSHLRNITTSVVNPFDRIGFNPKGVEK